MCVHSVRARPSLEHGDRSETLWRKEEACAAFARGSPRLTPAQDWTTRVLIGDEILSASEFAAHGHRTIGLDQKFQIISAVFKTFTVPVAYARGRGMLRSSFYPIFYAATPPEAWVAIAWLGRKLSEIAEERRDAALRETLGLQEADAAAEPPVYTRKRKANDQKPRAAKKYIEGFELAPSIDFDAPPEEFLELEGIFSALGFPLAKRPTKERVELAREAIELYYSSLPNRKTTQRYASLEALVGAALGYGASGDLETLEKLHALRAMRETVPIACWRGETIITVPRGVSHPTFVIIKEANSLTITLAIYDLEFTLEAEGKKLFLTLTDHAAAEKEAAHRIMFVPAAASARASPRGPTSPPACRRMTIVVPREFDENSARVTRDGHSAICITFTERPACSMKRRRIAANDDGDVSALFGEDSE